MVIADLDGPAAAAVATQIGSSDQAAAVTADVTSEVDVGAAFRQAVLAFGGVDLVINNAGLSVSRSLLETTAADWDLLHDVLARGSFLVSREAAQVMQAQGMGGDIVYIVSKNSVSAGPDNLAYGAAKADQAHQVRLLAAELGKLGIRVNGINPDAVVRGSGIFAGGWGAQRAAVYGIPEDQLGRFYAARTLLGQEVLPEHVAAAVDLGASFGRVIVGRVAAGPGTGLLRLREVHRFANEPVVAGGTLHWDILRLYAEMLAGLRLGDREFGLASAGIDSWGVDFGLLDASGTLLGNPVHYRDARTAGAADRVLARLPAAELYAATGIQQLPFNTIYQLAAAEGTPQLQAARTLLLIPDLLAYWLTGKAGAEVTNASTTQLLDVRTRSWATSLMVRAGVPPYLFPQMRQPGDVIGELVPEAILSAGMSARPRPLPLIAVGSHDTASAVAAVPAADSDFAYISCGTWALVGVERDQPVLTEASRMANFTNEVGIDGTIRYLRNVMGLWLLQESMRAWSDAGMVADHAALLRQAAQAPPLQAVVDPNDPAFLPPGDMPSRIARACEQNGQRPPQNPAETVRCIIDSLALAFRRSVLELQALTGRHVDTVHIVGGGARNRLLCQLTADACGLPVIAGPVEAAALGNVLVQARALRAGPADLDGMRALVRATQRLRHFKPGSDARAWENAARRVAVTA